jgi:hypothetical protein
VQALVRADPDQYAELCSLAGMITDYRLGRAEETTRLQVDDQASHHSEEDSPSEEEAVRTAATRLTRAWLQQELELHSIPADKLDPILQALECNKEIECENRLLQLVGAANLQFIQDVLPDRQRIYYSVLYNSASEAEKPAIARTIRLLPQGEQLYRELGGEDTPEVCEEEVNRLPKRVINLAQVIARQQEVEFGKAVVLQTGYERI